MTKKELLESEDLHGIIYDFLNYQGDDLNKGSSEAIEDFIEKELKIFKPTLFTTEDGVEIKKMDSYVRVTSDFNIIDHVAMGDHLHWPGKIFSTISFAENWIFMNKPSISLQGLLNLKIDREEYDIIKKSLSK